ncbi:TIP41-like protein, partial [Rozella allomycis CSF55]
VGSFTEDLTKVKPYDWTYTTNFTGFVSDLLKFTLTDSEINLRKLKEPEPILFYDELVFYEDELADNGISSCSLKIRVMPSGYFLLQRFYLRVDNVVIRVYDTRVHCLFATRTILRECIQKESSYSELGNLPREVLLDSNLISNHLKTKNVKKERMTY